MRANGNPYFAGWADLVRRGLYRTGLVNAIPLVSRYCTVRPNGGRVPHLGWATGPKVLILYYHRVGKGGIPLYCSLPPQQFEAQIRFLRKHFSILSMDQAYEVLSNPDRASRGGVVITFDDGYRDVYRYAFPILLRYAVPATIFLTAQAIETGEAAWYDKVFLAVSRCPKPRLQVELKPPRVFELSGPASRLKAAEEIILGLRQLPEHWRREVCAGLERNTSLPREDLCDCMLDWAQVREMLSSGIQVGAHTMTHRVLSQLGRAEVETELRDSKDLIEKRAATEVPHFAFPFGKPVDFPPYAGEVLAKYGYSSAATTLWGCNDHTVDKYRLYRVQVGQDWSMPVLALELSRALLYMRGPGDEAPVPAALL